MKTKPRWLNLTYLPAMCYLTELALIVALAGDRRFNALLGLLWATGQIGAVAALHVLHRERIDGTGRIRLVATVIAALGACSYFAHGVIAALGWSFRPLLPTGALLSGIGLSWVGVNVWRAKQWTGWRRVSPLLIGLYPFVIMFPAIAITGHPNVYLIMLWGVPWLLLGVAFHTGPGAVRTFQPLDGRLA